MKWLLALALNCSLLCLAEAADSPEKKGVVAKTDLPREATPAIEPAPRKKEAPVEQKANSAVAKGFPEEEFICPIDGQKWKQRMEGKGNPAGLRLDLKQVGDVIQPASAPHCPKCGMVLFADRFPEALIRRLRPFILSPDFQMLSAKSPVYAKLAVIQEFLGAGPIFPAYSYLKASWEVESKPVQHQRYLAKALDYFNRALADMDADDKDWLDVMLLCAELERRLQRWDLATERLQKVASPERYKAEPRVEAVVRLQSKLIAGRDSMPHLLGDLPGATVKPVSELQYSPMQAVDRKPKRHLQPLDMHESLVMNVEEPPPLPPLPRKNRWAKVSPLPNPPGEALASEGNTETVDAKTAPRETKETEVEEPEPAAQVVPELVALPAPKAGVRRKPEIPKPAPKPAPKEVVKEVVKSMPPPPKPEPKEAKLPPPPKPEPKVAKLPPPPKPEPPAPTAVLAPQGEKKTRPKLIGAP